MITATQLCSCVRRSSAAPSSLGDQERAAAGTDDDLGRKARGMVTAMAAARSGDRQGIWAITWTVHVADDG